MRAEDMADLAVGDSEPVVARADIDCRPKVQRCEIEWDTLRRLDVTDVHSQRATPTPRWYTGPDSQERRWDSRGQPLDIRSPTEGWNLSHPR